MLPDRAVVDASVAIKWVFQEARSDIAAQLLTRDVIAPDLLFAECANAIWKYATRGQISADEAHAALAVIVSVEMETVGTSAYVDSAISLAIELGHPVYDCLYLAMAENLSLPLVTDDEQFVGKLSGHRLRNRIIPLSAL